MGARKDGACEGAMHSPWSEVGTFLVVWQGHLTQCMHCTPLYDRWTTQISPRDLELNGAWKREFLHLPVWPQRKTIYFSNSIHTSQKKWLCVGCLVNTMIMCFSEAVELRGQPFDCWVVIWGMGDFRKKYPCRLISREEKIWQGNTWWKKILDWKKYLSWHIIL